jgi:hypothetical protein
VVIVKKKKKKDGGEVLLRVIIFGSFRFLSKKSNQTEIEPKPVQTGLTRFFRFDSFWLVFFPVWLGFFPDWVRFGFFGLRLIKPKPNQSVFSKF